MKEIRSSRLTSLLKNTCSNVADEDYQLVTFLNPYSYLLARKHISLLGEFDVICYDGFALVIAMRLFGKKCHRISFDMTSLAPRVFQSLCESGERVFFVGGEPGVAIEAVRKIRKEYPELAISGVRNGFFCNSSERAGVVHEIARLNPDVVVVGMGTPLQERFLLDLKENGWDGVGYTCGGFLHQTASKGAKYYPEWMNLLNLRWVYRIIDEPKLVSRYFFDYPKFMVFFLYDVVCYHIEKKRGKPKG